jgi:hypothetical protein
MFRLRVGDERRVQHERDLSVRHGRGVRGRSALHIRYVHVRRDVVLQRLL